MGRLADSQLPIEMCPLSNVATGVVESVAAHPIRQFFDQGLMVSVNSDDPAMFGHSLSDDYEALIRELAFSPDEARRLILNGIESSWLSPVAKTGLRSAFAREPAWSENPASQ